MVAEECLLSLSRRTDRKGLTIDIVEGHLSNSFEVGYPTPSVVSASILI